MQCSYCTAQLYYMVHSAGVMQLKLNGQWLKLKRAKTKTGSGCPYLKLKTAVAALS